MADTPDDFADAGSEPRRERILWAAARQFAASGFAGTRIDGVAADAGVNKQLIYYYFGNKAGLYDATLELMVDRLRPAWAALHDSGEFRDVLTPRLASYEEAMWTRLLAWEGIERRATTQREIPLAELRRESLARFVAVVQNARDDERALRADDPEMTALAILFVDMGPQVFPQLVALVTGLSVDSDRFVDRYAAALRQLFGVDDESSDGLTRDPST